MGAKFSKTQRYAMGFISATASQSRNSGGGTGTGGYLTASKLGDGESSTASPSSPKPTSNTSTVWGESEEGQKKPFRFAAEPSAIRHRSRTRRLQTAHELRGHSPRNQLRSSAMSFFCFDYADSKIKVFEITQKTLIKRTRQALARTRTMQTSTLGISK